MSANNLQPPLPTFPKQLPALTPVLKQTSEGNAPLPTTIENKEAKKRGPKRKNSIGTQKQEEIGQETKKKRGPKPKKQQENTETESLETPIEQPQGSVDEKLPSRYDNSLGVLTKNFLNLLKRAPEGIVDLNEAAKSLGVQKRRIYDITNVLEGISLIEKRSKNLIHWRAGSAGFLSPEERAQYEQLKFDLQALRTEDESLDQALLESQYQLRTLLENQEYAKYAFVLHEDIRRLPNMENQTLIAIKAPAGTTLEVPDPDEGMSNGKRRYEIWLENENRNPIDVILLSKDDTTNPTQTSDDPSSLSSSQPNSIIMDAVPHFDTPVSPQKVLSSVFSSPVKLNVAVSAESTDQYLNPNFVGVSDFFDDGEEEEKKA